MRWEEDCHDRITRDNEPERERERERAMITMPGLLRTKREKFEEKGREEERSGKMTTTTAAMTMTMGGSNHELVVMLTMVMLSCQDDQNEMLPMLMAEMRMMVRIKSDNFYDDKKWQHNRHDGTAHGNEHGNAGGNDDG